MARRTVVILALATVLALTCGLSFWVVYYSVRMVQSQMNARGTRLELIAHDAVASEVVEVRRFPTGETATLAVDSDAGDVIVGAADVRDIEVRMTRRAWGATTEAALAAARALTVTIEAQPARVALTYRRPERITIGPSARGDGDRVSFAITVPLRTDAALVTRSGDIGLHATEGDADVRSSFGDVTVTGLRGSNVDLRSSSGAITAEGVSISGTLTIETDFGDVRVADVRAAAVELGTQNGALEIAGARLSGNAGVRTSFGAVTVRNVRCAALDAHSKSGALTVEDAGGAMTLETDFGDITVRNATEAGLDARTSSGAIRFSGRLSARQAHHVRTDFGDIVLEIPADSAFDVDLRTEYGKVRSDLPLTLSGEMDAVRWRGRLGRGGVTLTATTRNGDIEVRALSSE